MRSLLSANIRDEDNLMEWIDYHLCLGFDGILIWDDQSNPSVERYNDPKVHIIRSSASKLTFMLESVNWAKRHGFDFLIHLDGDEYLYLPENDVSLFTSKIPSNVITIYFPWLLFGSNGLEKNNTHSCVYAFTRCALKTNAIIKPFVRVSSVKEVKNPHVFVYNVPQTAENTRYAPLTPVKTLSAIQAGEIKSVDPDMYFIAHYRNQSWEQFRRRKGRARDDTNSFWKLPFSLDSPTAADIFHKDCNQMEFHGVVDKYTKLQYKKTF